MWVCAEPWINRCRVYLRCWDQLWRNKCLQCWVAMQVDVVYPRIPALIPAKYSSDYELYIPMLNTKMIYYTYLFTKVVILRTQPYITCRFSIMMLYRHKNPKRYNYPDITPSEWRNCGHLHFSKQFFSTEMGYGRLQTCKVHEQPQASEPKLGSEPDSYSATSGSSSKSSVVWWRKWTWGTS